MLFAYLPGPTVPWYSLALWGQGRIQGGGPKDHAPPSPYFKQIVFC